MMSGKISKKNKKYLYKNYFFMFGIISTSDGCLHNKRTNDFADLLVLFVFENFKVFYMGGRPMGGRTGRFA